MDGGSWTVGALPKGSGDFARNATGKDFEFRYKASGGDQFYISGATAAVVPEPSINLLMASGLGSLLIIARRRRSACFGPTATTARRFRRPAGFCVRYGAISG